jgi:hypothetical protein
MVQLQSTLLDTMLKPCSRRDVQSRDELISGGDPLHQICPPDLASTHATIDCSNDENNSKLCYTFEARDSLLFAFLSVSTP